MALDAEEQDFLTFALGALPRWMRPDDVFLRGAAKMFGQVKAQSDYWFGQTLIGQAQGPTTGQPDWLNQHARDRGTSRQSGESDPALRQRIRNVPDALTRSALIAAANAILASESISGSVAMVELPRDAAYSGKLAAAPTGTAGTFATAPTAGSMIFTPTAGWAGGLVPYRDPSVIRRIMGFKLTIASATAPANDGTFAITGLNDNGVIFANGAGVAGIDGAAAWTITRYDVHGNALDGFSYSYTGRGWRSCTTRPPRIVLILPYGSTPSTEVSIRQMLTEKKAAGVAVLVERRLDPP